MPIEQMREKIDKIDARIVELLAERVDLAKKIGQAKVKRGLPIRDEKREGEVLHRATELSGKTNLSKGFTKKIFEYIIEYSRENE